MSFPCCRHIYHFYLHGPDGNVAVENKSVETGLGNIKIMVGHTHPVIMQDPIRKHFGYTQIWPLRPKLGQILYAVSDFLDLIWFHSSKESLDHVQNQPGNQSRWPGQVLAKHICLEGSWCAGIIGPGSGKMQPACYWFPTFRLCCMLPKTALVIFSKTSLDPA